ncbi:MAG TPA: hypothetical protein VKM55_30990 [Candidatus Lokiarchaeia archaeon]|nr:hypothetical protein [Candidatus Lokiarchaeia archaeon]
MLINEENFEELANKALGAFRRFDDSNYIPLIQMCRNAIITQLNWSEYYIITGHFLTGWGASGQAVMNWKRRLIRNNLLNPLTRLTTNRNQFPQDITTITTNDFPLIEATAQEIAMVTGPVIAAKIMHLYFPDLFIPLDNQIANEFLNHSLNKQRFGIQYGAFLRRVLNLIALPPITTAIDNIIANNDYPRPYIIDKVFWIMAKRKKRLNIIQYVEYCNQCNDFVFKGNVLFEDGILVTINAGGPITRNHHDNNHPLQRVEYEPDFLTRF